METKVEALEGNKVKVTVTIDSETVDSRIKRTYKDVANKYNFPGFRKGKAPRRVIDNAFGALFVTATVSEELVNETYPLAIDSLNLFPVSEPEFGEDIMVEEGKDLVFDFVIEKQPEYELTSYEPVEIELPYSSVTEEDIDDQIDSLRDYNFTFKDAPANTKVKADSNVSLAIKATADDGENLDSISSEDRVYEVGSGLFPSSFDEQIIGLKKGESASFEIEMSDAENSVLMAQVSHRTRSIKFEVTVNVVKKKVLPELTDEWVKDTIGFETVADLRARVTDQIAEQKAEYLPRLKERGCLTVLASRMEEELPQGMVEQNESQLMQEFFKQLQQQGLTLDAYMKQEGITAEQFKEDVKAQAADVTREDLALDAWARHFEITATEEDVLEEFSNYGIGDPEKTMQEWRERGQLRLVRQGIERSKAMLDIMEKAIVTELEISEIKARNEKKAKKTK